MNRISKLIKGETYFCATRVEQALFHDVNGGITSAIA